MDVFRIHGRVIDEYARFTRSFVDIADKRIADVVDRAVDEGSRLPSGSR